MTPDITRTLYDICLYSIQWLSCVDKSCWVSASHRCMRKQYTLLLVWLEWIPSPADVRGRLSFDICGRRQQNADAKMFASAHLWRTWPGGRGSQHLCYHGNESLAGCKTCWPACRAINRLLSAESDNFAVNSNAARRTPAGNRRH